MKAIRNIVLDLGGVLYDIDVARTTAALAALAGRDAQPLHPDSQLFHDFEMGKFPPPAFREMLREALDANCLDEDMDRAWNALLLGPIHGRLELLQKLKKHFRIILLSNTNTIHQDVWLPQCRPMFDCMERTFFSFDLGMRKPDPRIYEVVLAEMGMEPAESIFLDDNLSNLDGAASIGMQTKWIDPHDFRDFEDFCLKILSDV